MDKLTSINNKDNIKKTKKTKPSKKELLSNTKGHRKALGRPKGDAAIMNEYKARMLTSPKSEKVLESIFNAALDDDHKHQASAWKMIVDRIMPVGMFEKDVINQSGKSAIQINITGIGVSEANQSEIVEGEIEDVS